MAINNAVTFDWCNGFNLSVFSVFRCMRVLRRCPFDDSFEYINYEVVSVKNAKVFLMNKSFGDLKSMHERVMQIPFEEISYINLS